jgi:nitrogen regulatory protein PII
MKAPLFFQSNRCTSGLHQPVLSPATAQRIGRNCKGKLVKLIIAAIKPFKLEEVREALTSIGVRGMMVTEIKGFGSQSGHTEIYRGAEYAVNFVPKVKIEIVVTSAMVDQVVETIATTAKTDKIGDGKIFVTDVSQAVRVRTGETNDDAL